MSKQNQLATCCILQAEDFVDKLEGQHFDVDYWRDAPGFSELDGGRGGSVKIELQGLAAVLRQYKRGGLIRYFSADRYIWAGKSRSRPWREWQVLRKAHEAGLPVARPLGACFWRSGFYYRAALITAFLEGTETLAERLARSVLDQNIWFQLGRLLKNMQSLGFRHADLNASNLLIDQDSNIYVIDFDKGQVMKKLGNWQWSVLYRLQRSLVKIDSFKNLNYAEDDWQALMDGYQSSL
ncbi:MAG: 3-deoxy-D-manno-octulosonic acid kinase [Gammaproteobacteria bacterium]|nr:3-deoxy-D-manno-octulosonic acid kinase [Gammaproteobacteria bacterium]